MKYLLDTQTILWWITDEKRLSRNALNAIENSSNSLFLSAASSWEIAIKTALGRIIFNNPMERVIVEEMARNGIKSLAVEMAHGIAVHVLPMLHNDPFDRMLIAQVSLENIPLMTANTMIT